MSAQLTTPPSVMSISNEGPAETTPVVAQRLGLLRGDLYEQNTSREREARASLIDGYMAAYETKSSTTKEKINLAKEGVGAVIDDMFKIAKAYDDGEIVSGTITAAVNFTARQRNTELRNAEDAYNWDDSQFNGDRQRKLKDAKAACDKIAIPVASVSRSETEKNALNAGLVEKVDDLVGKMMGNPFVAADVVNAARLAAATVIVSTDRNAIIELAKTDRADLIEKGFPSLLSRLGSVDAVRSYLIRALSSVNMTGVKPLDVVKGSIDDHIMAGDLYPGRFGDTSMQDTLALVDDVLAIYSEPSRAKELERKNTIKSLLGKTEAEMAHTYSPDPIELCASTGDPKVLELYGFKRALDGYLSKIVGEESWNRTAGNVKHMYGGHTGVAVDANARLIEKYEATRRRALLVRSLSRPVIDVSAPRNMGTTPLPNKSGKRIN